MDFFFPKWCWTSILFSKIVLSFKKKKKREKRNSPLLERAWPSFSLCDGSFFSTAVFTCIIFGEVLFPGSPKSVTRWRMIWTCRVFVAGKISPLRGSEGVRDTKLMLDHPKGRSPGPYIFLLIFKHNFHINVKDSSYSYSRWPSNIIKDILYSIFMCPFLYGNYSYSRF